MQEFFVLHSVLKPQWFTAAFTARGAGGVERKSSGCVGQRSDSECIEERLVSHCIFILGAVSSGGLPGNSFCFLSVLMLFPLPSLTLCVSVKGKKASAPSHPVHSFLFTGYVIKQFRLHTSRTVQKKKNVKGKKKKQ